jgi:hypothetical protein
MTHTTTHPFDREILFTPRRSDFVYDVFVGTEWVASARYQGAGDFVADEVCYAHIRSEAARAVPGAPDPRRN